MVSVRDVDGQIFVERLARYLFENYKDTIKPPNWAFLLKQDQIKREIQISL